MSEPLSYREAGVDIDETQRALRAIQKSVQMTHGSEVIGGIGGFGGLFQANFGDISKPLLVSSIDGVGTKTKVAAMVGEFGGLGKDIVHHCVNDILCQGARPLFFLDYYGCSKFAGLQFEEILHGMSEACRDLDIALIGGETAEMPGVYNDDEIDIVGSIIGVVDADRKLPRGKMKPGDMIIGLESDGLHTNGYSLARRALFEHSGMSVRDQLPESEETIGQALVAPHRCYFHSVYPLIQSEAGIFAAAHITGGGLYDNPPRVMPSDVRAVFEKRSWPVPPIFKLIQATGRVSEQEMYRAFNMGIGFMLFVDRFAVERVVAALQEAGERPHVIGELSSGSKDIQII